MFSIQDGITTAAVASTMFLTMVNISQLDKIERLEDAAKYQIAYTDSNKTRIETFENNITEIRKVYNEEITDINNTPIGGTINFGL